MPRKHKNLGPCPETFTGPGALAPYAFFPPPLGRPKITRRKRPEVVM
jgi:hypothetical protein